MRFIILSQYFPPEVGAPPVRLAALARQLRLLGHEVEVVTAMPNYPTSRIFPEYARYLYKNDQWEGLTVHRSWLYTSSGAGIKRMLSFTSFALTSLMGLFRSKRPDYVLVSSPPLFLSIPAWIASSLWRVPFIFSVADLWPDTARELGLIKSERLLRATEVLERWTYQKARFVSAVTEGIRDTLIEKKAVPREKVLFMPNGVDTDIFKPILPNLELAKELGLQDKRVIVYAGIHGYAQGLDVALDAMALVQHKEPRACLVFIGDGAEKGRLESHARELGLTNVVFLPPNEPSYVNQLYSFAVAGFASLRNIPLFEGARPAKILAIMATGKPVIYSGSGEAAKLIAAARAGITVEPENANALAEAIAQITSAPLDYQALGHSGRRFVEDNFSWNRIVRDWLEQLGLPPSKP